MRGAGRSSCSLLPRGPATASDIGNNKRCIGNLFTRGRAAAFVSVWRRCCRAAAAWSRQDLPRNLPLPPGDLTPRRHKIPLHLKSQLQLMSGLNRNCEDANEALCKPARGQNPFKHKPLGQGAHFLCIFLGYRYWSLLLLHQYSSLPTAKVAGFQETSM